LKGKSERDVEDWQQALANAMETRKKKGGGGGKRNKTRAPTEKNRQAKIR